ncbi:unnamed protein product [Nezara viridula]|uniref:RCK N-terminal domain-containing protein n=1 Tax=Nezara viridula TaxID=85310 RepID=A0A9P0H3L9_NEZVI|nr:unnamed protein product [Nezara viridula]
MERQKLGGSYSSHRAQSEKHVVVCSTTLHADTIMDFLNEFYAHPLLQVSLLDSIITPKVLQDYYVVLLSPMELDTTMRMILQVPIWAQRVIYIQGSCLKDVDLARARMNEAEACFVLAARNYADKTAADEHTILRSWAVKDFAPSVPQYVQIFRPENKLHVKFAEHVVCEDELKYALLANNCTCPGASTLVTLLLHTSRGHYHIISTEKGRPPPKSGTDSTAGVQGTRSTTSGWRIRGSLVNMKANRSRTPASILTERAWVWVDGEGQPKTGRLEEDSRGGQGSKRTERQFYEDTILLNPGPRHIMKRTDTCYYMSITKEENSAFVVANQEQIPQAKTEETIETMLSTPKTKEVITTTMMADSVSGSTGNHLGVPKPPETNPNLLSPEILNQRRGSRRPSILPVPDMITSSTLNISATPQDEIDESEDEMDDDVPWRSPSEKIA